jgi:hypothetical protein
MIASPERSALEVLAPWVYSYVTSDGTPSGPTQKPSRTTETLEREMSPSSAYLLYALSDDNPSGGFD